MELIGVQSVFLSVKSMPMLAAPLAIWIMPIMATMLEMTKEMLFLPMKSGVSLADDFQYR